MHCQSCHERRNVVCAWGSKTKLRICSNTQGRRYVPNRNVCVPTSFALLPAVAQHRLVAYSFYRCRRLQQLPRCDNSISQRICKDYLEVIVNWIRNRK